MDCVMSSKCVFEAGEKARNNATYCFLIGHRFKSSDGRVLRAFASGAVDSE